MIKFMHRLMNILFVSAIFISCGIMENKKINNIESENLIIVFDNNLHSKISAKFASDEIPIGDFSASEIIKVSGKDVADFAYLEHYSDKINDTIGSGIEYHIVGESKSGLQKNISIRLYDDFPKLAIYKVTYTNNGVSGIIVDGWTNHRYSILAKDNDADQHPFWSYQSGSYESRPDWVLPIKAGFRQQNYMGMNDTDYGGGTPVSDVWRKDTGIAVTWSWCQNLFRCRWKCWTALLPAWACIFQCTGRSKREKAL